MQYSESSNYSMQTRQLLNYPQCTVKVIIVEPNKMFYYLSLWLTQPSIAYVNYHNYYG